eukprot:365518-Chlamydomonas_euryale.AAC.3
MDLSSTCLWTCGANFGAEEPLHCPLTYCEDIRAAYNACTMQRMHHATHAPFNACTAKEAPFLWRQQGSRCLLVFSQRVRADTSSQRVRAEAFSQRVRPEAFSQRVRPEASSQRVRPEAFSQE